MLQGMSKQSLSFGEELQFVASVMFQSFITERCGLKIGIIQTAAETPGHRLNGFGFGIWWRSLLHSLFEPF